ncbi:MFS transporter [Niastella populi]|uniref:MFS transporter n=1 Tax=Niastella populi TaxID=550983 RepID=A0A1V9EV88_9BACT|nr:MFS transporter [Niastella populi]OQP49942.1 MFS transporter [Niastella populi]
MSWRPEPILTEKQVNRAMKLVIADGLASEAMIALTSGTFLVAMLVLLDANNFQIGLLAGLPTFTNIFQLLSVWLVRRFNNRRAIVVISSFLARTPLLIIGVLILFLKSIPVETIVFILFFHYFFGSVAGPCWNAWMKDLIPEKALGAYFSKRTSYTQLFNIVLGLLAAFVVDYTKNHRITAEVNVYACLFIVGGIAGIMSALFLSNTAEPMGRVTTGNILTVLQRPLRDRNFRKLLVFNSAWVFALNIATPFFVVFMMKKMGLSISWIIGLGIASQICSILTVRMWGRFADNYSNKTVIGICAPLYMLCLIGWCYVGIYTREYLNILLLFVIHAGMGVSNAGINLSLTNISLKLSPADESVVYLSTKNIITALFSFIAPLIGGYMADYFSSRSLSIDAQWKSPDWQKVIHLLDLHEFKFLFLIAAGLAFIAAELLITVKETGEVAKNVVRRMMRTSIKSNLKEYFLIGQLIDLHDAFRNLLRRRTEKVAEVENDQPVNSS